MGPAGPVGAEAAAARTRAQDDHRHVFFDPLSDAQRPANATFGELADQFLGVTEEEASANGTSLKWVDKQRANVALSPSFLSAIHLRSNCHLGGPAPKSQ